MYQFDIHHLFASLLWLASHQANKIQYNSVKYRTVLALLLHIYKVEIQRSCTVYHMLIVCLTFLISSKYHHIRLLFKIRSYFMIYNKQVSISTRCDLLQISIHPFSIKLILFILKKNVDFSFSEQMLLNIKPFILMSTSCQSV